MTRRGRGFWDTVACLVALCSCLPEAGQELQRNEEAPGVVSRVGQLRPLEMEQRAGGRPRRRRDLGSRLQAQRRTQRMTWAEVDENEEETDIPGERGPAWWGRGVG